MYQMKSEMPGAGRHSGSPILTKSNALEQIPMLWKVYDDLRIKKRDGRVDKWVRETVREVKSQCENSQWKNSETLKGYITLHDEFTEEKGIPSSCEVLINLILERGSVPRINTFVDIYNVISVITGVSIGAHDIRNLSGNPRLQATIRDMPFAPIGGSGGGLARVGEYAYIDDVGVICRMDIKQCDRTKITNNTRRVLVIFQGHQGIGEDILRGSILRLDGALETFGVMV